MSRGDKYAEIDWSKGHKFLDKELIKITRNTQTGNRIVDKLIEVYRKDGEATYVILHLEIQGAAVVYFEERMFTYFYRLRDLHHKPIASLAILVDRDEKWRPGVFRQELWGSSVEMRFPIIRLIDYRRENEALEQSENPFAQVILAQLAALEKRGKLIKSKLEMFPKDSLFVVYCAGSHCNGANKAVVRLASLGFKVKEMIGGVTG